MSVKRKSGDSPLANAAKRHKPVTRGNRIDVLSMLSPRKRTKPQPERKTHIVKPEPKRSPPKEHKPKTRGKKIDVLSILSPTLSRRRGKVDAQAFPSLKDLAQNVGDLKGRDDKKQTVSLSDSSHMIESKAVDAQAEPHRYVSETPRQVQELVVQLERLSGGDSISSHSKCKVKAGKHDFTQPGRVPVVNLERLGGKNDVESVNSKCETSGVGINCKKDLGSTNKEAVVQLDRLDSRGEISTDRICRPKIHLPNKTKAPVNDKGSFVPGNSKCDVRKQKHDKDFPNTVKLNRLETKKNINLIDSNCEVNEHCDTISTACRPKDLPNPSKVPFVDLDRLAIRKNVDLINSKHNKSTACQPKKVLPNPRKVPVMLDSMKNVGSIHSERQINKHNDSCQPEKDLPNTFKVPTVQLYKLNSSSSVELPENIPIVNSNKPPGETNLKSIQLTNKHAAKSENNNPNLKINVVKQVRDKDNDKNLLNFKLRKRKTTNYVESSFETSREILKAEVEVPKEAQNCGEKLPIYKREQLAVVAEKRPNQQRQDDLYEFDSDSEKVKKAAIKRKRHKVAKDSSYDEYNKTISEILKNVMKKVEKNKQKALSKETKNKLPKQNIQSDVRAKTKPVQDTAKKRHVEFNVEAKVPEETTKDKNHDNNQVMSFPFIDDDSHDVYADNDASSSSEDENEDAQKKKTNKINIIGHMQLHMKLTAIGSPSFFNLNRPNANSTVINGALALERPDKDSSSEIINSDREDDASDNDQFFGFHYDSENEDTQKAKVHEITHNLLKDGAEVSVGANSPSKSEFSKLKMRRRDPSKSPWRVRGNIISRRPYLLSLKESGLPNLSQDPILDYTFVREFEELSKTRVEADDSGGAPPPEQTKNFIQTIVTDFFESTGENKENANPTRSLSLFDEADFSPVKASTDESPPNFTKVNNPAMRRILHEISDNVVANRLEHAVSTPIRGKPVMQTPGLSAIATATAPAATESEVTYFGFDSEEDEDPSKTPNTRQSAAKPFRLPLHSVTKQYERKRRYKKTVHIEEEAEEEPIVVEEQVEKDDSDSDDESDPEEQGDAPVGLFEDAIEIVKDTKPTRRRKKVKWLADNDDKANRRRKDVRTKEEEEAAEEWAAAFNSMCEEIEKFPLEIE